MSILINSRPETWSPVYAPLAYNIDSTNKNEVGFNYYIEVYSGLTLTSGTRIAELKIPPAPTNGRGWFDVRRIVDSYTEFNLPTTTATFTKSPTQFCPLWVRCGEQTPRWRFTTNFEDSPYVAFNSTEQHNFEVGDEIIIAQDLNYPSGLQSYEGLHVITDVPTSTQIVTDQPYLGVSNSVGGFVSHANGGAITLSGLTSDTFYGYKASFTRDEMSVYTDDKWISVQGNNLASFLTECPNFHQIGRDDEIWLSTIQNSTDDALRLFIRTSGATGNEIGSYSIYNPFSGDSKMMVQIAVGVDQLDSQSASTYITSGSLPIFTDPLVTQYSVVMLDGSSNTLKRQNFKINDTYECSRFGNKKLVFRDRKGSLVTFNFPFKSKEKKRYQRKLYNHINFGFSDSSPYYETPLDGGQTQFTIDERTDFEVYTDWLTEDEAEYFVTNLIPSPQVYEYQSSLVYKPVVLPNGTYEVKKRYNGMIQYKLKYSYALQDYLWK